MKTLNYYVWAITIYFNLSCTSFVDNGDKFLGEWVIKNKHVRQTDKFIISKNGEDYLVDFQRIAEAGSGLKDRSGSYKNVGRLNGTSIFINEKKKISLIDNGNKLLYQGEEYVRPNEFNNPMDIMLGTWIDDQGVNKIIINKIGEGFEVISYAGEPVEDRENAIDNTIGLEYTLENERGSFKCFLSIDNGLLIQDCQGAKYVYHKMN